MRLVMAIIQDSLTHDVLMELADNDFRATKLSSTGGFFKSGSTTILVGCEATRVEEIKRIINKVSDTKPKLNEKTSNAVVFVLDMNKFIRM